MRKKYGYPRPHGQASRLDPLTPNPCLSKDTHVVFALEPLSRPRRSPWLLLVVSVQILFIFIFFCSFVLLISAHHLTCLDLFDL